ncbi:MAG: hypothetical protein KHZ96_07365 [Coprobacillus sp.]|nr:hypothetical protein [Coprobacillus sp.]
MDNFVKFKLELQKHFDEMQKEATHLFEVNVDKDELWNIYLDSFPLGTNNIFRERREHDCSCCRQFIKNIGNAVVIKDNQIHTIWELNLGDTTYQPVCDALDAFVKSHTVVDIYTTSFPKIGTDHNFEEIDGKSHRWDHFFLELPRKFVNTSNKSNEELKGQFRDTRNVFKRSLDEITMEALNTILELINSNTLYKGEEWKVALTEFKKYKKEYDKLASDVEKELYTWEKSVSVGMVIGRIRNHSIGTLLINVSEGMDLDTAVKKYEQIVAPTNYKRSKPIYTKAMLEKAQKQIVELGYMDSLSRRYATLDDITVNDILFSNKDSAKRISGANDIFGELAKNVEGRNAKKFSKVEEVTIDSFINDILPTANEVELYLENKHLSNLVSLIAPQNIDSKSMFKWGNNFSWAYSGNLTDSNMRDRVKAAGGNVTGDLRFSLQWNESGEDDCDLDAHCKTPCTEIYYRHKVDRDTKGKLDVDIIHPGRNIAVENIAWVNRNTMKNGKYLFFVRQFSGSVKNGFRAEIEFDGQIYSFDYPYSMRSGEDVNVAEVTYEDGKFTIKELLPSNVSSKEVWNIKTNDFVPVSVICYSPNYWENVKNKTGHRHVFFMLKNCINDENPSGMFNEFLVQDLYGHRKVMEALSSKMRVEDSDDQLSGVGFATDKRAEVIVKVIGNVERVLKIKF